MSQSSSGAFFHGTEMSQSTYVRMTPCSGEACGIFSSLPTSFRAFSLTSSGMPAASIFSRSSLISELPSSSPSSFWMAFICSRRMYSRWVLSSVCCTSLWIFAFICRISFCFARKTERNRSRSMTPPISSSCCRWSMVRSWLCATRSAKCDGSSVLFAVIATSGTIEPPFST